MIKIGGSKLNTRNGIICHIKKYFDTDNNLSPFFKIREHYLINWIFVDFVPLDDQFDDSLSICFLRGILHNINKQWVLEPVSRLKSQCHHLQVA